MARSFGLVVLALGSFAITRASLAYFDAEEEAPFVIEKLPLPHEALWLGALKIHVVAAAFALPACLLLMSTAVLRRAPSVHRWLGRTAGGVVLLLLVPSGFYLSLFAKGGWLSTVGFMLTGTIAGVAMVQAVRTARAGNVVAHRRWVWHVLAQLGVAVSSRVMLFGFDAANVDSDVAYLISLWLPVLASAALVEWLLPRRQTLAQPRRNHEAQSRARLVPRRPALLRRAADA